MAIFKSGYIKEAFTFYRLAIKYCMILLFAFLMVPMAEVYAQNASSKKSIGIGIILDVEKRATSEFIRGFKTEISKLLKAKYSVEIEAENILRCNWSIDCIEQKYQRLVNDTDIDMIIGLGVLNGAVLTRQTAYPKPVIVVGVIDPGLQQIPITAQKTSGVHNLTYLMEQQSLYADLKTFYKLYPYRKIALVEDRHILEIMPEDNLLSDILKKKGVSVLPVAIDSVDAAVDGLSGKVDAVIIGSVYRFEIEDRVKLIEKINAQNLPTFAVTGVGDLKLGALSATRPETDLLRISRRVALNIERILDGEDPAALPLTLDSQKNLYVNMETARKIGFSPAWDIIMDAELINPVSKAGTRALGLRETIQEALASNRTMAAKKLAYRSKEEDVTLSKTDLFPQVGISAGGTVIDEEHAVGGQAERTTGGKATLDQVIFSEQLWSNVTVNQYELKASLYSLNQTELDTVQETGIAYFDILNAATNRRVRKDYLDLVKKNLDIARKRLSVGYAGAADVYRWESEIASAKNNLIEAETAVLRAKQRLNQLLFRPIDEEVAVRDVALSDNLFNGYPEADLRKYLGNQAAMEIFADFLVLEAQATLPEIKEINELIKANERVLLSYKRKRYSPDILLGSQADRSFSRSGAGSEVPLPDETAWQVGVNATWPIFQGGEINSKKRQLRIDISQLEMQKTDLTQSLELDLRNNVLDLISESFNIKLSKQAAEAGGKSLALVQDSYEKGLVSIVQLLDAQNAALTSELSAASAVYEYFSNYLNLERSMGRYIMLSPVKVQEDFFNRFETYRNKRLRQ